MKRIDAARVVSKSLGETRKNLEAVFRGAREHDAVLLFDEANLPFTGRTGVASATDRYANLEVAVLLRELERYPGVAILTTNPSENIDSAFRRRPRFGVEFSQPDAAARNQTGGCTCRAPDLSAKTSTSTTSPSRSPY